MNGGSFFNRALAATALLVVAVQAAAGPLVLRTQTLDVDGVERRVAVPRGTALEFLAGGLSGPRFMAFAPNGELFVGSISGDVYRLSAPYTEAEVFVRLQDFPHSVAFRDGEILVALTSGLYRAAWRPGQPPPATDDFALLAALPGGSGHSSRTVSVGPDGRVYLALGISGNCSDQYLGEPYPFEARRGGVLVLDESTAPPRWDTYASGLRNPVGIAWQPGSGVLYASNHGPDHLGFEQPPEYFSRLTPGSFHGMPWFQYDGERLRPDRCATSTSPLPPEEVVPPVATFAARSAPMGVAFIPDSRLSPILRGSAAVALHGSWATRPDGDAFGEASSRREPAVMVVRFEGGEASRVDPLVTGFQSKDGSRWARPAGVAVGPDGYLYFSSDGGTHGLFRLKRAP